MAYAPESSYGQWPGGAPEYQPAYNPLTMNLNDALSKRLSGIEMNKQGLEKYRSEALRTGPSAWASNEMKRQLAEEAASKQRMGREAAGRTAEGESALAMRGGLTSGARERLQHDATRDYLDMSQNLTRQAGLNQLQVQSQDEQNRVSQLGQLPGMEAAALQPDLDKARMEAQARAADIANQVGEGNRRNDYNQTTYGQQMQAWGANRTAQATENAGKK